MNFNACVKRKCVDIPTNPDDILESNEQFYVTLARNTDDPRIQPQEIIQYFTIMDDSTGVWYSARLVLVSCMSCKSLGKGPLLVSAGANKPPSICRFSVE